MTPDTEHRRSGSGSGTEERLRAALAARAGLVTYRDLRHDAPPRGRSWGTHRIRRVAVTFTVLGAAVAAVAAGVLALSPGTPPAPAPVLPAGTPGTGEPPVPTRGPVVTPAPAAPSHGR
ncbi:hypothetical protein ABZ990_03390 [Streptomyces sp. NPDC046203]|uniref:hypothetical protein n=1 Tax=Streptomyces sp. NPDC046203 TaxID=3154602 RepID=UPI0033F66F5D